MCESKVLKHRNKIMETRKENIRIYNKYHRNPNTLKEILENIR